MLRLRELLGTPSWPDTVEKPPKQRNLGVDYDTAWARTKTARAVRAVVMDGLTRPLAQLVTSPTVYGAANLQTLQGPVIFAANHTSHLDTAVVISCLPDRYRHHTVVAAAADYFFDRKWKAGLWALLLGTIPVERNRINRKSADVAACLLDEGWSLVIYPEGGRSHDGWAQEFRGGAAYLSKRCEVPVVPVHLRGVRPVYPRGGSRLRPGKVEVRFGSPLRPLAAQAGARRDEDARRYTKRIEAAVAGLADEAETDWWSARRRAASGNTPPLGGPESSPWLRAWSLPESARKSPVKKGQGSSSPW